VLASESGAVGYEVSGRALEDDPAAIVSGAGTEIDDPVGVGHGRLVVLDDDLVVLDDDERPARVDEPIEQAEQLRDVGQVEAASWLVGDVDTPFFAQVGDQLEPLPLHL